MRTVAGLALVALALFAPAVRAEEDAAPDTPSPVGLWRLDRDGVTPGIDDAADELIKLFLVPDMELRILEGGRFEAVLRAARASGAGEVSDGTWVRSRDVVSFASLRDDGQPGSMIGRLRDDLLVLDVGNLELPFRRVVESVPPEPPAPEVAEEPPGSIGIGPGPSIRLPQLEREDESWPPLAITGTNHRRVAKRTGAEVVATIAKERQTSVSALWQGVPATRVLHIQSAYDRIQPILDAWQIPHMSVSPREFLERGRGLLNEARVVFVPCLAALPKALEYGLSSALRDFVANGGYLATTDWSVESVLQPAFPLLVATTGRRAPMGAMTCIASVTPAAQQELDLVRGLSQQRSIPLWCATSSFDVQPLRGAETPTMLTANQPFLQHKRSRTLLFVAAHGGGKILHSLPQLHQERGSPQGARVLQRIFLNFALQALDPKPRGS